MENDVASVLGDSELSVDQVDGSRNVGWLGVRHGGPLLSKEWFQILNVILEKR